MMSTPSIMKMEVAPVFAIAWVVSNVIALRYSIDWVPNRARAGPANGFCELFIISLQFLMCAYD